MDDQTADRIMRRFAGAYFRRDPALLADVVTDDVEWHFAIGDDGADGRVRRGVDGILRGIEENAQLFEQVRFDEVACRALGDDAIVMTYVVHARPRGGEPFSVRGIELISLRDGRIAKKDVFWKQRRPGG
jgi:ketosteroid isomerase-like protein